jgi:hypothetical protein
LLRRLLVPAALDEHSEPVAVLIDGPPQIMALRVDREKDLIQVLLVTGARTAST